MQIDVDKVITLENNINYVVTEKTEIDGNKYFRAVELNPDYTPTDNEVIYIERITDGNSSLGEISESDPIYEELEDIFDEMLFAAVEEDIDRESKEIEELDKEILELQNEIAELEKEVESEEG